MDDTLVLARIDKLQKVFNRTAVISKYAYYILSFSQLVIAAAIPVVALVSPISSKPVLNGVLGAAILLAQGAQQIIQPHRKWIQHRVITRTLASEKYLYLTRAGRYHKLDTEEAIPTLSERTEYLADLQNKEWRDLMESALSGEKKRQSSRLH